MFHTTPAKKRSIPLTANKNGCSFTLGEYIHDGKTRIIVDLGDVSLIGYQGLGTLVERLRQARSRGGDLRLCRPSRYIRKMFEMVGAEQVFDTYDSELAALASFGT